MDENIFDRREFTKNFAGNRSSGVLYNIDLKDFDVAVYSDYTLGFMTQNNI